MHNYIVDDLHSYEISNGLMNYAGNYYCCLIDYCVQMKILLTTSMGSVSV